MFADGLEEFDSSRLGHVAPCYALIPVNWGHRRYYIHISCYHATLYGKLSNCTYVCVYVFPQGGSDGLD